MSKQFEKAEDRLKKSLTWSMKDGNTGYNSWRQSILGRAQVSLKKYMDGEQSLLNAKKMHEAFTNKDPDADTDLARIYTDLGRVRAAQGKVVEAQQLFEKSAEILKPKKRRQWDYLRNQLELANLYRDVGQFTKAEDLYTDIMGRLYQGDEGPERKDVERDWDLLREKQGKR
ncbi:MAG: tetratricopeptide repeat protein [Candidatus Melainabacteria bacterium]|nr:tetratricopeptide repeat protein [Candidatus Melainabacteria bacterium]